MNLAQLINKIVDDKLKQWKLDTSKQNSIAGGEDGSWSDSTQKVKTLNALNGDVTISAAGGLAITPTDNDIEITAQTYTHNQIAASTDWTITHNLGRYPSVTIVDSGGNVVIGDVEYMDSNNITVHFTAAFGGKAYLN